MVLLFSAAFAAGVALYAFYRYYPPFGGRLDKVRKARARSSVNYARRKFINYMPTDMDMGAAAVRTILRDQFHRAPHRKPARPLEPRLPLHPVATQDVHVTWLGHSAVLVHMRGKNLLLDPMLGKTASPFPSVGPRRFKGAATTIDDLPQIDVVLISHDHYDHLDYSSIKKLKHKANQFFVPLGVGAHLERWGVDAKRITELDWWEEVVLDDLKFICTPSRHFSGRTLTDRFKTLWASWVIDGGDTRLFFSGDTGYGPHFKKIGQKYGPFDLTMMECGQYDRRWANIHMMPEQTAAAHADLRGKLMLPMHWGTFRLAFHDWTDSVERVLTAAGKIGARVATPRIGETFVATSSAYPTSAWWKQYESKAP
jgi:L-ascorbate metabolism protein UlaG (beta-lactamase superfamily)